MKYITNEESYEVCRDYDYKVKDPYTRSKKSKAIDLVATLKMGDGAEVLESEWDLKTGIKQAIYNRITVRNGRRFQVTPMMKISTKELGWYIHRYK